VIATGDLMHGLLPYMGDGFPDEWPDTLRALKALKFDLIIPGHGSIPQGKSVLVQFRGYVEEVTERVSRGVERGQTLDELKNTITPGTLVSLKADDISSHAPISLRLRPWKPDQAAGCVACRVSGRRYGSVRFALRDQPSLRLQCHRNAVTSLLPRRAVRQVAIRRKSIVPKVGLEPTPPLQGPDFESGASAINAALG
jgi:hypothetical protein